MFILERALLWPSVTGRRRSSKVRSGKREMGIKRQRERERWKAKKRGENWEGDIGSYGGENTHKMG